MPSFLRDLSIRRRSKVSFGKPDSSGNSLGQDGSEDRAPSKSSSTLSSSLERQTPITPLSTSPSSKSNAHLPSTSGSGAQTPPLPGLRPGMLANSQSVPGGGSLSSERALAPSPYAPRALSVADGSWVHHKVLLITGKCGDPHQPLNGTVTVYHHQDLFPVTHWPVCDSHFKALIYLQPGFNRVRLEFTSPKLAHTTSGSGNITWVHLNHLPLNAAPPVQLCLLVAKDSPGTYDAVPERVQREGNGLETAIQKFRMAAYLWQTFTAEQMSRNGFGKRCFRYEEDWQPGTLSVRDADSGQMRNEARIHIIRMNKTVKEIQALDCAQQYEPATTKGALYDMAMSAVRTYFAPRKGQKQYVTCMFLDSHWDNQVGTIRGHAALGGGDQTIKLAIFGSHCLQSYPSHIEEVTPAFSDCTRTDLNYVANDCNDAGSNWEAVNIGIGAHLHETGHLLGCPHQESGIMARDYVRLNRTFAVKEPYSTRTKQQGKSPCLASDECGWHRLDALRFRFHPCFQLPGDLSAKADLGVQVWPVDNGNVLVTAATGVAWVEIRIGEDDICRHWIEYFDPSAPPTAAPRQITLTEQDIRDRLPDDQKKAKQLSLSLQVFSCGGGDVQVPNFLQLCSAEAKQKLPDGRAGFQSSQLGAGGLKGSRPHQVILGHCLKKGKSLLAIKIHHGQYVDGIEFCYDDKTTDLFGKRTENRPGSDFPLDTRRGEMLLGFSVRAGLWIDAIQVMTTTGRRSALFGNLQGGTASTLIPPRGYGIAGVYGSCGPWLDSFGLIITR